MLLLLSFSLLGASFSLALRHNDYIAPSVKPEICIPIEEKYSQLILNTYLTTYHEGSNFALYGLGTLSGAPNFLRYFVFLFPC